jgi:4,5-dihydroxyphthalate decarboxylase
MATQATQALESNAYGSFVEEQLKAARETLGEDFWSYGVAKNRATIDTFLRHHHAQGLSSRRLSVEEIFHPATYETYSI